MFKLHIQQVQRLSSLNSLEQLKGSLNGIASHASCVHARAIFSTVHQVCGGKRF